MREKILHFLKKTEGYISGEEISEHLKISRAAIWKYMQELRHLGYDIVAVPHLGYQLVSSPDQPFTSEIQFGLKTKLIGKRIDYYEKVISTMDMAFQAGLEGAEEGTVVVAETQTKGRGRLGRIWVSPEGKGIYLSILLRPQFSPNDVAKLTLLSGVAVCEAIRIHCGITPDIKWPNDLQLHGKKVAGILTELNAETDRVKFVVIGLGLNVNTPMSLLPQEATSLKHEAERQISRVELTKEILRQMEHWYLLFLDEGFLPVAQKWRELSVTLGRRIRIQEPQGILEGEAINIDSDGGLLIRKDSGVIIKKMTADILQVLKR